MKIFRYAIISCFVLLLTTCQSISSIFQEPRVSFKSVEIAGIGINGVDLLAHVNVENPNGFSIPLPKVDWELFINSAPFVEGIIKNDKTIKSRGNVTLDLPLSFTYDGLYKTFTSLINTKEIAYNVAMGLSFPLPLIEEKVFKLDFSGNVPLLQIPVLKSGSLNITRMDYTGISLAAMVNVENPNPFPIPIPDIDWDYNVNGVSVLKSNSTGRGEIAASAAGIANVNVSVAYADIFRAVSSAMNSSEAKSNLLMAAGLPISALDSEKTTLDLPGILPILQKPEISFQGIEKRSLGTTMEFLLNWEVDNKNSFAFDIAKFSYDFMVNNSQWATGQIANPPKIKAAGKTLIPLTVSISAASLVRELVNVINLGSAVNYYCTGDVSLQSDLPGLDIPNMLMELQGSTRIR